MAKVSSEYVCQQCGFRSSTFLGKCPECGTWNSLVEQVNTMPKLNNKNQISKTGEVVYTKDFEQKQKVDRLSSRLSEFDRVLGGGIVPGSVVLIAGDPGIGKSTLLSQLAINVNTLQLTVNSDQLSVNNSVLYVAGEESAQQIKLRVERISKKANLAILNETDVDIVVNSIDKLRPTLVIVDSIQTMETEDLTAAAGSVSQVRESTHRLQRIAKLIHTPIFIVGHVTKEGTVAGPRTLEHLVDVVLNLEGESSNNFRILRAAKNRFGPTDEVGIFEMEESGMKEVINPSQIFLDGKVNAPGSAVTVILTGLRPMLLEIQALVTKSYAPLPRRIGTGIDNNRLTLLVAVLQKRLGLPLFDQDVFVNVTGGIKINEPAADLAICMSIVSSLKDQLINKNIAFVGEVGLLGELRVVRGLEKRIVEAKKLGFTKVISPTFAKSLAEAVKLVLEKS